MTADVCDLEELNSGQRREGMLGAIYWWMVKFGLAFAGLASGAIMSLVGFEAGVGIQIMPSQECAYSFRIANSWNALSYLGDEHL